MHRSGIKEFTFADGLPAGDWIANVSIFLSSKPDEKESQAALDCAADLAGPGIRIGLVLGSAISTKLAQSVLEHGGSVIGWAPEGLDRYKAPKALTSAVEENRFHIASIAKPHQAWNPQLVGQSSAAALVQSRAALFVDPAPKWLGSLDVENLPADSARLFHIRYQSASEAIARRWQELQARPVGRRNSDGRPNLEPIRQSIGREETRRGRHCFSRPSARECPP